MEEKNSSFQKETKKLLLRIQQFLPILTTEIENEDVATNLEFRTVFISKTTCFTKRNIHFQWIYSPSLEGPASAGDGAIPCPLLYRINAISINPIMEKLHDLALNIEFIFDRAINSVKEMKILEQRFKQKIWV